MYPHWHYQYHSQPELHHSGFQRWQDCRWGKSKQHFARTEGEAIHTSFRFTSIRRHCPQPFTRARMPLSRCWGAEQIDLHSPDIPRPRKHVCSQPTIPVVRVPGQSIRSCSDSLSRGLMRSLSQLPVLHEKVVSDRQWEVKVFDATVLRSPLAIAELRF